MCGKAGDGSLTGVATNPLLAPSVLSLARRFESGRKIRAQERPVLPLIARPRLSVLRMLFKRKPELHAHPLVAEQIAHLCTLQQQGVVEATRELEDLVDALAQGLLPSRRIRWGSASAQKPGRKGGFTNPHPTGDPPSDRVDTRWVKEDLRELRQRLKVRLKDPNRPADEPSLCQEVLESSRAAWWSGWREDVPPAPHPHVPGQRAFLCCVSSEDRWKPLPLDRLRQAIEDTQKRIRFANDGAPSRLAYAILATLLDVPPDVVRDRVGNVRAKGRRVRRRRRLS